VRVTVNNSGASTVVLGTTTQRWSYDGLDRVTSTADDNGPNEDVHCTYLYDSLSRQIRESQRVGAGTLLSVDCEWQGENRRVTLTYPDGRQILRSYDALDRLFEVREGAGNSLIAGYEYVGPNRDALSTLGNGVVLDKRNDAGTQTTSGANRGYDSNRRHLLHEWRNGATLIAGYSNTYNGPGGIGTNRRVTETRRHLGSDTDHYTFDSAYRMLTFLRNADQVGVGGALTTCSLDGADKLTAFVEEGPLNRLPVVDGSPPDAGINQYSSFDGSMRTYDANGSTEQEDISVLSLPDGDFTYRYDFLDRLVEVRDTSASQVVNRYAYDAAGRRVVLDDQVGTSFERYIYDGWQVLEERDAGDALQRQYVEGRGLDEHVQVKLSAEPFEPAYYYHANSQGSVGALTNEAGDVVEYYTYRLFGDVEYLDATATPMSSSTIDNRYLFHGRRREPNTALYYYRNRYYHALTGEFLTQDPLGNWQHGQGNGYSAFGCDAWNRFDPLGLDDVRTDYLREGEVLPKGRKRATYVDEDFWGNDLGAWHLGDYDEKTGRVTLTPYLQERLGIKTLLLSELQAYDSEDTFEEFVQTLYEATLWRRHDKDTFVDADAVVREQFLSMLVNNWTPGEHNWPFMLGFDSCFYGELGGRTFRFRGREMLGGELNNYFVGALFAKQGRSIWEALGILGAWNNLQGDAVTLNMFFAFLHGYKDYLEHEEARKAAEAEAKKTGCD
jgi:RHS repeat-associated protein